MKKSTPPPNQDPAPSPVVLLRWTPKGQQHPEVRTMVQQALQDHRLVVLPSEDKTLLLVTASQETLEAQAQADRLVKPRRVHNGRNGSPEVVMDHFTRKQKGQFVTTTDNNHALFSAYETSHLVMGLLDDITLAEDSELLQKLTAQRTITSRNLCYLLQHKDWVDVLTPLHDDALKEAVHKKFSLAELLPTEAADAVANYYGPGVAYYFAFVGFLGRWLAVLGTMGLCTFVSRVYRHDTIDEDEYTPLYGLVCFVWAVLLVRFWEREECRLAYRWGTLELAHTSIADDDELVDSVHPHRRPDFKGIQRLSPVTGQPELYFPPYKRKLQYLLSFLVTSAMLAVAFAVMILSLNLQGYIRPNPHTQHYKYHPFYYEQFAALSLEGAWFDAQHDWKPFLPVILHAVCILLLNTLYRTIARKLTKWENHETQQSHEQSLVLKRFLFEAFDCYIVLFYLAFYERDVDRLRSELVAVFNIDSFRRLGTEVILPYVLHKVGDWKTGHRANDDDDHPHDLHLDEYEPFDDYMEVLIQFGYVVLFASAYPLASLLMAGALWLEIRTDVYKLTHLCQKPAASCREHVRDLGVWKRILSVMVWGSCLTNCLLFGYTSDQMMHYLPDVYIRDGEGVTHLVRDKGWIAILIIFGLERALLLLGLLLHTMIPVVPESLTIQLRRRAFLLSRQSKKSD